MVTRRRDYPEHRITAEARQSLSRLLDALPVMEGYSGPHTVIDRALIAALNFYHENIYMPSWRQFHAGGPHPLSILGISRCYGGAWLVFSSDAWVEDRLRQLVDDY